MASLDDNICSNNSNNVKVAVVCGSDSGIGYWVVKRILQRHPYWIVYLTASKSIERAEAAVKRLRDEFQLEARCSLLDVTSLQSVQHFCAKLKQDHPNGIDVFVNNATFFPLVKARDSTPDIFKFDKAATLETVWQNYFSTLRVCSEMFPLLAKNARVVLVSSSISETCFLHLPATLQHRIADCRTISEITQIINAFQAVKDFDRMHEDGWLIVPPSTELAPGYPIGSIFTYGLCKLAINCLTEIYQKLFDNPMDSRNIAINACCPGRMKQFDPLHLRKAADTIVYLALLPENTHFRGTFITDRLSIGQFGHY